MLSFIVVCAIGVPLMIWALSPGPARKRKAVPRGYHAASDLGGLPPGAVGGFGGLDTAPSCDAGGGGCDGGGG